MQETKPFYRPFMPLWLAGIVAVASGICFDLAFPDQKLWPLSLVAIALMMSTIWGRSFWQATGIGALSGASFWGIHIFWLTQYLGPVPWLALTFAMTLSFAIGFGLTGLIGRLLPKHWQNWQYLTVFPILAAAIWITREAIASRFPYGGFSWGRVAFAHAESPYATLFAWIGSAGVGFVLVLVSTVFVAGLAISNLAWWWRLAPIAMLVLLIFVPHYSPTLTGTIRVAAVQGDAEAALNSTAPRGTILQNHIDATLPILNQDVDVLIWPENSSDLDPLRNQNAAQALNYISAEMGVPIVVGAITVSGDKVYNSSLLWTAQHGAIDQYDKIHPVPFAEYMPNREFFMALAPDLVSLVTRDYEFGQRDQIFAIDDWLAGIAICYDIADDYLLPKMVNQGAQIIFAQTNNADFGETDQNQQQLAIAKIRAYETARTVVNISTVGTSAVIDPSGKILDQLAPYQPGTMVLEVPLATGVTGAVAIAWYFEAGLAVLVALGFIGLIFIRRGSKKTIPN